MERFDFMAITSDQDPKQLIMKADDIKAMLSLDITEHLLNNADEPMIVFVLMKVAFDTGTHGMAFFEICQFFYDNYTRHQLSGLYQALTNPAGIKTERVEYFTDDELKKLKDEHADRSN